MLADENVTRDVVDRLRVEGHTVTWIDEIAKGAQDGQVLELAVRLHLPLLTGDLDFGGYIYRDQLTAPAEGIIQYRLHRAPFERRSEILAAFFAKHRPSDAMGYFVTIDEQAERFRPLP